MTSTHRVHAQQRRLEAILATYRDKVPRQAAERKHMRRLWREFIFPMRWRLLLAIILTVFSRLTQYIYQYYQQIMVDWALCINHPFPPAEMGLHLQRLLWIIGANVLTHFPEVLATWQANYHITRIGQRVVFNLRRVLHEKLQSLPLSFFDHTQTGRLLSVVLDDVGTIQASIGSLGVNCCAHMASILTGTAIICVLNWKMGLLVLAALPCYVFNFRYFRPRIREGNITARRANTAIYNTVEERITAIRTIKVFGRERAEVRSFTEGANNLARLTMYILRNTSWQNVIATAISGTATGAVLYLGMRNLQAGSMTLGKVLQFYGAAGYLFLPAVMLSDLFSMELPRVSVVLRRIFDLMEAEPEPTDQTDAQTLRMARGDIAFDQVTFTYPGDETPTLREISFAIPAGKQVAVMGPSGAGKSSLLYLLMRFYDPEAGVVTLDGHDLRQLKLLSVRDRVTLVMQEPVLFSGTVAENIRYGRLEASDEEVRRAARHADLHEFIMGLPEGYETVVGERGMSLSGGQRQRLALAASLVSQPSVLLLDDTTSALDAKTEGKIRATLNKLMHGRTCFVVTHRVSTAMASDLVLVLEDGRVTQCGAPVDLLTQEGLFRRVYEQQTQESADAVQRVG
jgi:subfamily B ATP-binding cassette protein MsbA